MLVKEVVCITVNVVFGASADADELTMVITSLESMEVDCCAAEESDVRRRLAASELLIGDADPSCTEDELGAVNMSGCGGMLGKGHAKLLRDQRHIGISAGP